MKKEEIENRKRERAEFSRRLSKAVNQRNKTRKTKPMTKIALRPDTFDFRFQLVKWYYTLPAMGIVLNGTLLVQLARGQGGLSKAGQVALVVSIIMVIFFVLVYILVLLKRRAVMGMIKTVKTVLLVPVIPLFIMTLLTPGVWDIYFTGLLWIFNTSAIIESFYDKLINSYTFLTQFR